MVIDLESTQDAIDQAVEEYEEKTPITEDLVRSPERRFSGEKCYADPKMNVEEVSRKLHPINVSEYIKEICNCERQKFFDSLESKSQQIEEIGDDLVSDLLKAIGSVSVPKHLYLPDEPRFRMMLKQYDCNKTIGIQYDVPIHWFRSDGNTPNKGFVLDNGVYVNQSLQGETPIITEELGGELPKDNSENRLKTYIRKVRGGKIEIYFHSEFSIPETIDGRSKILTLELPEIEDR
jgi:hypothetical protein